MSSNIRIEKQCEYCNETFIAKMTTTRYCSHKCNSRHYKALKREEKIQQATKTIPKNDSLVSASHDLSKKQYLSMKEAAILLGVHERTIMNMKNNGTLTSKKIGRRIIIDRDDLQAFIG